MKFNIPTVSITTKKARRVVKQRSIKRGSKTIDLGAALDKVRRIRVRLPVYVKP